MYYDELDGILNSLCSLESMNEMLHNRYLAHYVRNQSLREWLILGRFYLDSCGNTMKAVGKNIPAVMFPNLPPVIAYSDFILFQKAFRKTDLESKDLSFSYALGSDIPPHHLLCPECAAPWTIQNCHDTVVNHETRVVDLKDFIGKPLFDVKAIWKKAQFAVWRIQPEKSIRNDCYIDLTPDDSELGREYHWVANQHGWIEANDLYQIQPGDEALVNIWTYRHLACQRAYLLRTEKDYFKDLFTRAGFTNQILLMDIPNQYCGCEHCSPWFYVVADGLRFNIGWRKHVINLESTDDHVNFIELFPQENVTKGKNFIHAWGQEKCLEYLKAIHDKYIGGPYG